RVRGAESLLVRVGPDGLRLAGLDDPRCEVEAPVGFAAGGVDLEENRLDRVVLDRHRELALEAVVADEAAHRVEGIRTLHQRADDRDHRDAPFGDRVRTVVAVLEADRPDRGLRALVLLRTRRRLRLSEKVRTEDL